MQELNEKDNITMSDVMAILEKYNAPEFEKIKTVNKNLVEKGDNLS